MIVLIEMLIDKHREKVERWERGLEEWMGKSDYRYESQYRRENPHPTDIYRILGRWLLVVGIGTALFFFLYSFFSAQNENYEKEYAVISKGKNCQAFNLNDHVKIDYGAYADKTGVIVGGCKKGEDYQVKFDAGQRYDYSSDGQNEVELRQDTIGVDTYKNLIKLEGAKNESK